MSTGKANYGGGSFKKKNYYKLQDGDMVFRILGPLGNLKDKGVWSRFHSVHFGYKNSEGKTRPFESPLVKNNKTKMVEVPDAALDRLNDLKAKLESAKSEGNAPLVAKLSVLVGNGSQMGVYSVDNNHHMNVVTLEGNIGTLKIRHKAKMALDAEIKKLVADGVDPLADEDGRFFVFTRTGKGNETNFKVSVFQEKVTGPNGKPAYQDVSSTLGNDVLSRLAAEASDLDEIATKLSADEVAQVVAESDLLTGKSPACDRFIDARWKAKRAAAAANDADNETPDDANEPAPTVSTGGVSASTVPTATYIIVTETPAATPLSTTQPASSVDDLSDADFFKQIGVTA